MTDLLRLESAGFPDQRSFSNGSAGLKSALRNRGMIALGAVAALGIAGSIYCGIGYIHYERLAAAEQEAARRAEIANADLQDALARLRNQLGSANQGLNTAQRRIAELSDESRRQQAASDQVATSKTDRIQQLTRTLEQVQRDLHLAEAQRVTLIARLSKSEVDAAAGDARQQQQMQAGYDQWQKKVQQLAAERDKTAGERDRLRAQVGELTQKLSLLQTKQPSRPVAEARPETVPPATASETVVAVAPVVPAAPAPRAPETVVAAVQPTTPTTSAATPPAVAPVVQAPAAPVAATPVAPVVAAVAPPSTPATPTSPPAVTFAPVPAIAAVAPAPDTVQQPPRAVAPETAVAVSPRGIAQFERVLASAGVDVKHLFSQYGVNRGEGGPFIPAPRGLEPAALSADKIAALSRLVKSLPVAAPLDSYDVGSRFGVRGDPINGRASLHTGTDFRAAYGSPVYATAGGVVTYSGYRADYGKIVEIDHGNGLTTRYGHLHRAAVSVGQRVAVRDQIGWLGSTGRATGPHVHYEVLVNGEPQDPEKFIGLARIIPVVAQR